MTPLAPYILVVGAIVHFSGTALYLWNTLKGRTKPNRVTFFLWFLAPAIAVPAALSDGVGWAVLPVFMAGFGPLLIFLASFANPNAYWKLTKFDYVCGGLSLMALVLWFITKDPVVAIIFAIAADVLAGWPTVVKAWKYPETEHWSAFVGGMFSSALVFLVVEQYTFTAIAFPAYIVIICAIILVGIFRGRLRQSAHA